MRFREKFIFTAGSIFEPAFYDHVLNAKYVDSLSADSDIQRLNKICDYAYTHNAFYRNKYSGTLRGLNNYSDVKDIPCLTKDELITMGSLLNKNCFLVALASGGTGGEKTNTYLDGNYLLKRYEMLLSILYGLGWHIGDSTLALHPVEYGYFNNLITMLKGGEFRKIFFDFFQQYILYGIFHNRKNIYYDSGVFEVEREVEYFSKIFKSQPKLLLSRPDVLNKLVKQANTKGLRLGNLSNVITVGNLITGYSLKRLRESFNSRVYNMYASTELGYVGVSCDYSGSSVHIDSKSYLVETDRSEDNEVIITDFNNHYMPIIRYRTADIGQLFESKCECGRSGKMLRILGRKDRFLLNKQGKKVYGLDVDEYLDSYSSLWAYQLKRQGSGKIKIIVRPKNIDKIYAEKAFYSFAEAFDIDESLFIFDYDEAFEITASGKFCAIV